MSTTASGPQRVRVPLTRERVLAAALELIDREGIEGLSMRKLGADVGVEAMSLYNHVAHKGDVLDGVVALIWAEIEDRLPTAGSWQERVRSLATAVRDVAHRHPNAYPLMLTCGTLPGEGLRVSGRLLGWLRDAGFGTVAAPAMRAVGSYAISYTLSELAWYGHRLDTESCAGATDVARPFEDELAQQGWQAIAGCDDDTQFAFGLDLIIHGLEAKLAGAGDNGDS